MRHVQYFISVSTHSQFTYLFFVHTHTHTKICDTIPLVSEQQRIDTLGNEYTDDRVYCSKVRDLGAKYSALRRTRPDGNCFFRAFAYAYLEYLVRNKEEYARFRELAQKSKERLVKLGFPEFTLEDFHGTVNGK